MARLAKPTRVIVFAEKDGNEPFTQWLYDLKDSVGRKRILIRITRLEQGNYGDCEPVGKGVSELRMFFLGQAIGYISEMAENIVVLLCGGDKGSQQQDIKKAKAYWQEYLTNEKL